MTNLEINQTEHEERITYFADVIVPVPIPKLFTYRVPYELNDHVHPGQRAVIQFGKKKVYTGVIQGIHRNPPKLYEAKYLLDVLDDRPSLFTQQLKLIEWCSDYYMSTPGEVLSVALPSGLKLSSMSFVQIHPEFDMESGDYDYNDHEITVIEALQAQNILSYDDITSITELKNVYQLLKSLVTKNAVILIEKIKEKYHPKKEKRIRLKQEYISSDHLEGLFKTLEKRAGQTDILLYYLNQLPVHTDPSINEEGMAKSEVAKAGLSTSSLTTLIRNDILEEYEVTVSRLNHFAPVTNATIELSANQQECLKDIMQSFEKFDVTLLHGVTGSGKTEIYIEMIREAIVAGGQVLYLLPEIALTTQIVRRLSLIFGDRLGIYHSKYSDNERVEVWNSLIEGKYDIIIGARSSVFLPFSHLSLIIVDEEHETSYKQFEQAPRYHARDTAIVLARIHGAKTLLGSATPSFESYHNTKEHKYGLVTLKHRYGSAALPEVSIVSLTDARKKKKIKGEFTSYMLSELEKTLDNKQQAIIFQNRRGYSPFLSCDECAHVPKCTNCSVSLTYHMHENMLRCHYCGHKQPAPQHCIVCGSGRIRTIGFGTEKIEEDLKLLVPEARVERMDLDTTRNKYGYQQLIDGFEKREIDVLVGTQMVTKGLDFDHVRLVGVVDLDRMLHFPDFRATERCFQLVTQVSGRAGRRDHPGLVIVQTQDPYQPIVQHLKEQDYSEFYNSEINERRKFEYPPFYRLIRIVLRNRDREIVTQTAALLATKLKAKLGRRVLGPKEPIVSKIRNHYHLEILVKLEKSKIHLPKVKDFLKENVSNVLQERSLKSTLINFDVDPF